MSSEKTENNSSLSFFQETKRKLEVVKQKAKKAARPIAAIAVGLTMTSCATGHSSTATYGYRSGGYTFVNTVRYSELDAARANRENARAVNEYSRAFNNFARGCNNLRRAFR